MQNYTAGRSHKDLNIYGIINSVSDFEQLCEGIAGYSVDETGIVPWEQEVTLFRKNSIDRIPLTAKTD